MYKILRTEQFIKKFSKLDKSIQSRFEKKISGLAEDPFKGKSLNSKYFRELKVMNYRIYYAIIEKEVIILMLDLSTKKDQQNVINTLKTQIKKLLN